MIFLRTFHMVELVPAIAVANAAKGGRFSTGSTASLPCQAARSPSSPPAFPRQIVVPLLLLCWSSGLHGREILSSNTTSTTLQLFTYQILSTVEVESWKLKLQVEIGKLGYHPFLIVLQCWKKAGLPGCTADTPLNTACSIRHKHFDLNITRFCTITYFRYFFLSISESHQLYSFHIFQVSCFSCCTEKKKIVFFELTFAFLACPDGKTPRTPKMAGTLWQSQAINRFPEATREQCKKLYYTYPILPLLSLNFSISCGPKSHKKRSHTSLSWASLL